MNHPCFLPGSHGTARLRRAFTLIELLVVISIIAVLAGLLLPVVSKVMNNARKVETKSAAMQIISSIKSFQTDYGVYPVPSTSNTSSGTTDLGFSPTVTNAPLFWVLKATEAANSVATPVNTRSVVYFEGNDAKNASLPKSGFVPSTAASAKGNPKAGSMGLSPGDFVDSWGNRYGILIDTNYNNVIANPYVAGTSGTSYDDSGAFSSGVANSASTNTANYLRTGVAVWSPGDDGTFSSTITPNDDVVSWQ